MVMRLAGSLRATFTWWFAGTLVVLYGVAATAVWLHLRAGDRHYAILTLKAEGEAVASYLAATGRIDAPEFAAPETAPFPIWFRLRQATRILAETPGAPALTVGSVSPTEDGTPTEWASSIRGAYLSVHHAVGGSLQGTVLEVIAPTAPILAAERRLALALALGGIVVIPLAALGGRFLAQRAVRSVDDLVARIRTLNSNRVGDRLVLPPGTVEEVTVLAGAFNDLLGALENHVETMRRFTADASHEIRNPLSVLRVGLEVALRRPRDAKEYRRLIHDNVQEIQRLQAVLEGLLALAREGPGAPHPLVQTAVDFSDVVAHTIETFATVASERGIAIDTAIEPEIVIQGDAHVLRLAAFNLVDNALKHSPRDTRVAVSLAAGNGEITLVVADEGAGIPLERREGLFQRYSRARSTREAGVGGLGLSVVAWVAARHGGQVRLVDSTRGATFELSLPGPARAELGPGILETSPVARSRPHPSDARV
jgi:signal transduction histidine kinase